MPPEEKKPQDTQEIIRDVEGERQRAAASSGPPQDIVYELPDKTVVKGKSWEEIAQKTAVMKADTATALRDREDQIRKLKETPAPTREITRDNNSNNNNGFSKDKYQEIWLHDPVQAQEYLDTYRPSAQEIRQEVATNRQIREIALFHDRVPSFPGGNDAAGVVMQRLTAENKPITADNLESAYHAAVRAGELKPVEKEEEIVQSTTARRPPPSMGSTDTSSSGINNEADLNTWAKDAPMEDLRKTIERLERQKQ